MLKVPCMTICVCWHSISREVLIHKRMAMYFRRLCFLSRWSFVSFGIWRNIWGCVRAWDWNKSSRKVEQERKKFEDYIRPYVMCLELCISSSQSEKWENEWVSYRKWRVYIGNYVTWPASNHHLFCVGQNQKHGRSWNHKARDFSDP